MKKKKTPESTPVPDYKKLINHSAPDKIAKIYRCPVTYDKQIWNACVRMKSHEMKSRVKHSGENEKSYSNTLF